MHILIECFFIEGFVLDYRAAAYAHFHEHRKHIASFCGTGNNTQFLSDPTGNRRWLPFEVVSIESPRSTPFDYEGIYAPVHEIIKKYKKSHDFLYFSAKKRIFACKLQKGLIMEDEKRYPILDEEDGMTLMAADPVAGAALAYAPSYFDEDNLPLIGPATYEEAIERIEQAEREIDSDEGMDWNDFKLLLKSRYTAVSYAI